MEIDLSGMSRKELEALRRQVDRALEKLEKQELKEAIEAAEAALRERGYSLAEIAEMVKGGGVRKTRGTVAPKYRNPADGSTWSGRGRQPRWFREAIEAGRKPEEFLIDKG